MEVFNDLVCKDLEKLNLKKKYNLTREESQAIKELKENNDIIIKEADKGGSIVLMTREYYDQESYNILSDRKTYVLLERNPIKQYQKDLDTLLQEGLEHEIITRENYRFLSKEYPVTPIFYFLPKVHKNLNTPPGRPIISGIDSLTSNLSAFVDNTLQPYAQGSENCI